MSLGSNLYDARKRCGLSQADVAEKLGVSRQTISKWETDETIPDIFQSKRLANLYQLTLDELVNLDIDVKELERNIDSVTESVQKKVDWTKVWAKKYPVLASYTDKVEVSWYAAQLNVLLTGLRQDYGYSELDAMLVLKDILGKLAK